MTVQFTAIGKLGSALAKAQGELSPAYKTSVNPHFKNKFADLSEVWEACRAALSKHDIAVVQCPQFEGKDAWLETTIIHGESGESMTSRFPLLNAKGDMQGFGSSITYARRYSLSAMIGIIADDDDGNAASQPPLKAPLPSSVVNPMAGFDPKNRQHTDALHAQFIKRKVGGDWAKNTIAAMIGKPFSELDNVLKATNPESAGDI